MIMHSDGRENKRNIKRKILIDKAFSGVKYTLRCAMFFRK
jgi:hypothetical protein